MSEKVTFGELIESIAAETDHSKQFTHDFLKDFVDVIHGGLEEDGKVNIAGFGKFKLRHVEEREGYNPQTEEKMTIPAHNKIVFKPYKDLSELVNAPYAHMEPTLLEESSNESGKSQNISDSQEDDQTPKDEDSKQATDTDNDHSVRDSSTENELQEQDFIPTAPPTSHDEDVLEGPKNDDDETVGKGPLNVNQDEPTKSSDNRNEPEDDDEDIVEFEALDQNDDDILEQFIGTGKKEPTKEDSESQVDEDAESKEQDPSAADSDEEILAEEVNKLEETAEELKQQFDQKEEDDKQKEEEDNKLPPTVGTPLSGNRSSAFPYVAATIILLLLVVGGVWYYNNIADSDTPSLSSEQTVASNDVTNRSSSDEQQKTTNKEQSEETQQARSQSSPKSNTNNGTLNQQAAQSTSTEEQNETSVEIEEGQTLWSLAEERYGNPRLWPWIYGHDGSLEDPDIIYAGNSLSVPLPSGPQNKLNASDSVGVAKGFLATYKWYKSNKEAEAKNHLWAAKSYHNDLQQIADIPIDKTDLTFANSAR